MRNYLSIIRNCVLILLISSLYSCGKVKKNDVKEEVSNKEVSAKDILGNPNYLAMSYGGYRHADHSIEPTVEELKEDMKLMYALGIRILRTYKVHLPHASNVLKAIHEIKEENPDFEMYVMLGAWINCKNAFTDQELNHDEESEENAIEIAKAVALANQYPDIVKIIAVGNEAMVTWQAEYFVRPGIILKWVNYLQDLKKSEKLSKDLWVTSSDNFASWGGGGEEYQVEDLNKLIKAVDFISMHTYPMHDTHYQPEFWLKSEDQENMTDLEKVDAAMLRAKDYAQMQVENVAEYVKSIGLDKPIHIGETGWASLATDFYGPNGTKACDEYKEALYHDQIRDWTNKAGMSCFYFEGFDEPWKGGDDVGNSEKHFGLFTVDGKAKYVIWDEVDNGVFNGLTRNGNLITKTFNGNKEDLMKGVQAPPTAEEWYANQH